MHIHHLLHDFISIWFHWVEAWGYWGIFVLMAMESSVIPVPSEIVMPPAAFWAAQGKMDLGGVILAGTLGSYCGSVISYVLAKTLGDPVLKKFGKYVFLSPVRLQFAEKWMNRLGVFGVFLARLLPVVRHLISIPAGIFKMPFRCFSFATVLGAGLWCAVLSWFGQMLLGEHPELLQSPEAMIQVLHAKMSGFLIGVLMLCLLYSGIMWTQKKWQDKPNRRSD